MSAKEKSLNRLYKARVAHLKWVNTIKLLVSGFKVDQSHLTLPIIQDSEIGRWYYNEAIQFAQFRSQSVLVEMETLLEEMFNIYTKIYEIYFTHKQSTFKTLLGIKNHTVNRHEMELAGRYYEDIVKLSDEFKGKLHTLERQLLAMQENEHALVSHFEMEEETAVKPKKNVPSVEEEGNYSYGPRSR
ncbi:hypothetical protein [Sulfurovum mangrovi]|uniref:hypothetical protein n=1 Tax=Sulfurovum mangrovi TaxID=2893889 RepID=UPI001E5371F1|nr:hypothetical protein [Sulfurovum mangrovi]UFH59664.1 hypothetical protein LN246_02145 [Sulfurovum mangrovi]UFH60810.1 hypothetical protein LN246_14760 [Sulfurovum mangrovi]